VWLVVVPAACPARWCAQARAAAEKESEEEEEEAAAGVGTAEFPPPSTPLCSG